MKKSNDRFCRLLRTRLQRPRRRAAEQRDEVASPHGHPSLGLGLDITTPLRKNAAVHHSKNCALMSQMESFSTASAGCVCGLMSAWPKKQAQPGSATSGRRVE